MKKERHLTKFCAHPGSYQTHAGKALGWCKYCRMRAHGGVKYQELKAEFERDQTKRIQVIGYPCDFEFTVVARLPEFKSVGTVGIDYDCLPCETRNERLYEAMTRLKVKSPCHAYGDYVVEQVTKTPDGEIWRLGS